MSAPVVVVGAGLAGTSLVRELRKLDPEVPLTVIADDRADIYAKPNLSNFFASGKALSSLVQSTGEAWAAKMGVTLLSGATLQAIDTANRTLTTSSGPIVYRELVLAMGANPVRAPLEGDGAKAVQSVNSLADYTRFRNSLEGRKRVAILGAGLVGCEFADDLRAGGFEVVIFDPGTHPLGRLLPARTGRWVRDRLVGAGITIHSGLRVRAVHRDGSQLRVVDAQGNAHMVDAVLSAIGLRPRIELAEAAGIVVQRGIRVDRALRTSAPGVHALGDCAEVDSLVLPFVQPILHAARALAQNLAGTPTSLRYPAMPVVVKTPSTPLVVCPPPAGIEGVWSEDVSEASARAIFRDASGREMGFALSGEATREKTTLASQMPDWL